MAITGEAYGGAMLTSGWTNQNLGQAIGTLTTNIESGSGPGGFGTVSPAANGYSAWSMLPEDAIASVAVGTTATSFGWLTRVVANGGPCGHLDMVTATGSPATITGCTFAIYSASSLAVGPLAWSASRTQTFFTAATTLFSVPWDGASSPASVSLSGGQPYWIYTTATFSGSGVLTLAASTAQSAAAMNPNLTPSATNAANSMSISAAPVLYNAVTATSALAPQTTWTASTSKFWFGLRA